VSNEQDPIVIDVPAWSEEVRARLQKWAEQSWIDSGFSVEQSGDIFSALKRIEELEKKPQ
jgi:uncharacterized protein YhaN